MKRLLPFITLVLIFCTTAITPLAVVRAQGAEPASQELINAANFDPQTKAQVEAASNNLRTQQGNTDDCVGAGCAIAKWLISAIGGLLIYLLSLLQAISGTVLNFSINVGVVAYGSYVEKIGVINDTWATFRDLANIVFIFALLLIAIGTILNLEGFGYKKLLMKIILLALFVNFSLFIAKFIIDVSNLTATQFANAIEVTGGPQATASNSGQAPLTQTASQYGVGNAFASALSLQALFNTLDTNQAVGPLTLLGYILMGSIFIIISTVVFFAAAVIFIARAVELMFLMVLAPLAFAAWALPWTESYAMKWWERLFKNAIYAPVFMLLVWFTARVVTSDGFRTAILGTGTAADHWKTLITAGAKAPDSIAVVFYFFFIIGSLVACIWMAKALSIAGTDLGMKLGSIAGFAIPALAGRHTLGLAGGALSRSETFKRWAAGKKYDRAGNLVERKGLSGWALKNVGKGLTTGGRALGRASYDVRGIPGAGEVSGFLKDTGNFDVGSVSKNAQGGYEAFVKRRAESQKAYLESLKPSEEAREQIRTDARAEYKRAIEPAKTNATQTKTRADADQTLVEQGERSVAAEQKRVGDLESERTRMQARGDNTDRVDELLRGARDTLQVQQGALAEDKRAAAESARAASAAAEALKKLGSEDEYAKKAVISVSNARLEGAAKQMKDEVFGFQVPRILKSRGSVIAGIKEEEEHLKGEQQRAVDLLASALRSQGGGGAGNVGGGGGEAH